MITPLWPQVKELWEILVPTVRNDGRPYHLRFHRVWDGKVRALTKGLTVYKPVVGQWHDHEGRLYHERMIPVRISCGEPEIRAIMQITKDYYEQKAVMAYRVSDRCLLLEDKP